MTEHRLTCPRILPRACSSPHGPSSEGTTWCKDLTSRHSYAQLVWAVSSLLSILFKLVSTLPAELHCTSHYDVITIRKVQTFPLFWSGLVHNDSANAVEICWNLLRMWRLVDPWGRGNKGRCPRTSRGPWRALPPFCTSGWRSLRRWRPAALEGPPENRELSN